jgi:hypothetical protein
MEKLENMDKIPERLEKVLERIKGSRFKDFKHLEILKKIEERAPEKVREKLQEARRRLLERFKDKLDKLPPEAQEKFKDYVEKIKGDAEDKMEVLEDLREELKDHPLLRKRLEKAREGFLKRAVLRFKKLNKDCPNLAPPSEDFCKEGRIVIRKDENGCPIPKCVEVENLKDFCPLLAPPAPDFCKKGTIVIGTTPRGCKYFRCLPEPLKLCPTFVAPGPKFCPEGVVVYRKSGECFVPKCLVIKKTGGMGEVDTEGYEENEDTSGGSRAGASENSGKKAFACVTLWDPVCGANGKTYSNKCFAEKAGVEIAHKGVCKESEVELPNFQKAIKERIQKRTELKNRILEKLKENQEE